MCGRWWVGVARKLRKGRRPQRQRELHGVASTLCCGGVFEKAQPDSDAPTRCCAEVESTALELNGAVEFDERYSLSSRGVCVEASHAHRSPKERFCHVYQSRRHGLQRPRRVGE